MRCPSQKIGNFWSRDGRLEIEFWVPRWARGETMCDQLDYRPSGFYYRRALRRAASVEEAQAIGLAVVAEHERLKAWVRDELGVIPPKWTVHPDEAREKGWELTG